MAIPESQLETWSHQGASTSAKNTHEAVRSVLERYLPSWLSYEVYLQGSYRNSTNIRGDSDVDLVVELSSTFHPELSDLAPLERAAFHREYPGTASYGWVQFRADVLNALLQGFGHGAVTAGKKCLKIARSNGRLPCDVVPCLQYRHYRSFVSRNREDWIPGIVFWTVPDNRMIVNFPKPHYDNGVAKNAATYQLYKPSVRMLKNARNVAIDRRLLADGVAPSYFLECFAYNVPSLQIGPGSFGSIYRNVVTWWNSADLSYLMCQNGLTPLFGNTPEQWSQASAKQLAAALGNLWNLW